MSLNIDTVSAFYIGMGLGCFRTDFLLRWGLARTNTGRLKALLWYLYSAALWPFELWREHHVNKQMLDAVIQKYRD